MAEAHWVIRGSGLGLFLRIAPGEGAFFHRGDSARLLSGEAWAFADIKKRLCEGLTEAMGWS